jgi:DNA-binding NarL/FixJ family response regulator
MRIVKTLIADNHPIYLKGLEGILQQIDNPKIEIVATVRNGQDCVKLLKQTPIDLLIFDLNMPGMDGLEVLQYVKRNNLDVLTVLVTMYDNPKFIRTAFKNGVDAYLLKTNGPEVLKKCIREIVETRNPFMGEGVSLNPSVNSKRVYSSIEIKYRNADSFVKRHSLTKRELEILHLITQAMSNKEIGKVLFISDQTVSVHRKNIMRKLGVSNTAGLIKAAYDHALV